MHSVYNAAKRIRQSLFTIHVTFRWKQSEFTYVVFPNEPFLEQMKYINTEMLSCSRTDSNDSSIL